MPVRIALANLHMPSSREHAVDLAIDAIREAGRGQADLICFPECFVPGYRRPVMAIVMEPPDAAYLERAWSVIAKTAAASNVGVAFSRSGTRRLSSSQVRGSGQHIPREGDSLSRG